MQVRAIELKPSVKALGYSRYFAQRGPDSDTSCRLASSQSELASPGNASLCRRSEMK